MKIKPLPPSSDLLEFVDDQCIESSQGEDWQEPDNDHDDDDDRDDDQRIKGRQGEVLIRLIMKAG